MPFDSVLYAAADIMVAPATGPDGMILGYRVTTLGGDVIAVVRHREIAIAIADAQHEEEMLSRHLH